MKTIIAMLFIFISSFSFSDESIKKKIKFDGGSVRYKGAAIYESGFNCSDLKYLVDTKAKLCFATIEIKDFGPNAVGWGASMSSISCKNLKNRNEWKEIITWE